MKQTDFKHSHKITIHPLAVNCWVIDLFSAAIIYISSPGDSKYRKAQYNQYGFHHKRAEI